MMNENKCAARVIPNERFGALNAHQCNRKPGYGEGGLYCKQHAKQYPADDQETVTMYAANWEWRFGSNNISRCEVFGITTNQLVVKSSTVITGYSMPYGVIRLDNSDWKFFDTARDAFAWVAEKMQFKINALERDAAKIRSDMAMLTDMLAVEDFDERVTRLVEAKKYKHEG